MKPISNQLNMLQQQQLLQSRKRTFRCLKCTKYAIRPVVTQCGHIYCWQCIYKSTLVSTHCPQCRALCLPSQCYTIYTQHHQQQPNLQPLNEQPSSQNQLSSPQPLAIPPRPQAKHRLKIVNPNMIGIGMPLAANSLPSNVNKGKMLAGHVYMSPLGVNALSHIEEGLEEDEDYRVGQKYKCRMHLAIVVLVLLVVWFLSK